MASIFTVWLPVQEGEEQKGGRVRYGEAEDTGSLIQIRGGRGYGEGGQKKSMTEILSIYY